MSEWASDTGPVPGYDEDGNAYDRAELIQQRLDRAESESVRQVELIEKLADAVSVSVEFFSARDEMNAAVHTPSPVRLSPITVMVQEALEAWRAWRFGAGAEGEGRE